MASYDSMVAQPRALENDSPIAAPTVEILGVPVKAVNRKNLTDIIRQTLLDGRKGWVSYVNVHAINLAAEKPEFKRFLNRSLLNYCDGEGVRLGASILGKNIPERIVLTDWFYDLCEVADYQHLRVFFLGSTDDVLRRSLERLKQRYPGLNVCGYHHGYFNGFDADIVSAVNAAKPDILFVAMGMPRQEQWIEKNFDSLNVRLIFNTGSCLDYVAGMKRRCPQWMAQSGLEWLFRLFQEPRRLWKRYILGNPLFLIRIFTQRLSA
ncbi:MAG: WecB/TagA/CpsF family glycosyltransferase [Bacteroidota bacterium]